MFKEKVFKSVYANTIEQDKKSFGLFQIFYFVLKKYTKVYQLC